MLPAFERLRESVASERLSAATTEELLAGCECIGETCGGSGCLCIGRNRNPPPIQAIFCADCMVQEEGSCLSAIATAAAIESVAS